MNSFKRVRTAVLKSLLLISVSGNSWFFQIVICSFNYSVYFYDYRENVDIILESKYPRQGSATWHDKSGGTFHWKYTGTKKNKTEISGYNKYKNLE
jgi:hypothetical protein